MSVLLNSPRALTSVPEQITSPRLPSIRTDRRGATVHVVLDGLATGAIAAALLVAYGAAPSLTETLLPATLLALTWMALLSGAGRRYLVLLNHRVAWLPQIGRAGLHLAVLLSAASWILQPDLPRIVVPLVVLGAIACSAVTHVIRHTVMRSSHTVTPIRVLLVGHEDTALDATSELLRAGGGRLVVAGWCPPVLSRVAATAQRLDADDVIVLPDAMFDPSAMRRLAWRLDDQGRHLHLSTGVVGLRGPRARLDMGTGLTLVNLRHCELHSLRRTLLQGLGRTAAGLLLLAAAPVLLVLAIAVRLDSPGSAFFKQRRIGADGQPFTMLKFRTMTAADPAVSLTALSPDDTDGVLFKIRRDPRITRLGAILRRYSLDELPQLINVVRGDMALVGPRPGLPAEVAKYETDAHRRLAVRPGMTGLWQVSGRSDLSWSETVRLDLEYVDNWTPGLDLQILARTFSAVVGHRGAY